MGLNLHEKVECREVRVIENEIYNPVVVNEFLEAKGIPISNSLESLRLYYISLP